MDRGCSCGVGGRHRVRRRVRRERSHLLRGHAPVDPTGRLVRLLELGPGGQNIILAAGGPAAKRLGRRLVRFPLPHADVALAGHLRDLMRNGDYRPVVDRTYPFDEIRDAYAYVDSSRKVGNVVVTMPGAVDPGS